MVSIQKVRQMRHGAIQGVSALFRMVNFLIRYRYIINLYMYLKNVYLPRKKQLHL